MKAGKTTSYMAVTACAVLVIAGAAVAQNQTAQPRVATRLDVSYLNKYVWRGAVLNPDPVFQPSLTLTLPSGFSYNLWMSENTRTNAVAGKKELIVENDHTFNYAFTARSLGLNVGYIYYAFPNTSAPSTSEFYGSACLGGKFSPTLSINHDIDEVRGDYIALSSSCNRGLPLGKTRLPVGLSAKIGFGTSSYVKRAYPGAPDKAALLDLVIGATSTIPLGGHYSMTPNISYSTMLDSSVRNVLSQPNNFVAGLTVTTSF